MSTPSKPGHATCTVVAPSSREAFRLLRERLSPDAFVISNRVTADGVEIVATMEDPGPSPSPSAKTLPIVHRVPDLPPEAAAATVSAPLDEESASETATPGSAAHTTATIETDSVLREIHSMRGMIEEQLAGLAWNEKQRRDPVRGHLLRTLLGAGFSACLAKEILQNMATGQSYASGMRYTKSELARRTPMLESEDTLMDEGGVFALMGPTGVGKTTTTAKLAARCVMRFGPGKLALVTTDSYRIGAYEQLRIYGQILGVAVYAVKNAADLDLVLAELHDKHMVLIDTVGMSQRDRAVSDQIAMLGGASRPVKRLLLLNATSHGDTLNEVVQAYRHGGQLAGGTDLAGCIFTKVDEATHPGALLDMAIRHQLKVHYVSSGQKVPEHLMLADSRVLIDSVFQANSPSSLFVPDATEADANRSFTGNPTPVAETEAVSERLRTQCQQLIRALTHNAQELAANAAALAQGQIGFEETRSLWRELSEDQTDVSTLARARMSQICADSQTACSDYVLALTGELPLAAAEGAKTSVLASTLLLSDRDGQLFAVSAPLPTSAGQTGAQPSIWTPEQAFDKPLVHLFAQTPASGLIQQWQASGHLWAASGSAAVRVVDAASGQQTTLAKLAIGLSFSTRRAVMYRKKKAWLSLAEAQVSLRTDHQDGSDDTAKAAVLRCVVRRMVDADSGKPLATSYVLASVGIQAGAEQLAQWPAWRTAADPCFKLLKQALAQLDSAVSANATTALKRRLVAGQAVSTVFRLQGMPDAWADSARQVLAQLAGRALRPDRPVPGTALLEGLGKLFPLLDALETEAGAPTPKTHLAWSQD